MKDFSHWSEYDGASEGSGRSEKIWLINNQNNAIGLFKYRKDDDTTDHVSECIAYKLACLLGIECAEFELGEYNGRVGSMSYSVLKRPRETLIEGINYIISLYPEYDISELKDRASGKMYSIEMIKESISDVIDFKEFLTILLFDYLIGNTDRHQSNWAFIKNDKDIRMSPLYDNSSSLCAYINQKELLECLGKDKMKWKSVVDTKSKSIIRITSEDKKRPTHLKVLQYIKDKYYVETIDMVNKMVSVVNDKNIDEILESYSDSILSINKKKVIKKFLLSKIEMMQEVYF